MVDASKAKAPPARSTIEVHASARGAPDFIFAAAKAMKKWAEGQEVTAEEFDAAIDQAANIRIGYADRFAR